ncbi:MAG: ral secretion pathway protein [Chthoniobacter sp.]|jgi:hypothetical protein|nr:ral secretion pathway protein [Chthoniobacter sp.]
MNLHSLFTAALEASWQGSLAILFILALRPLLVWLGFRYLRADRELAADEWALQQLAPDRALRPRRLAGSFAGLGLVIGMAAIILTAAESPVGALSGWSVVSISIPKNGEIKDAYVELKSPAGRVVTLTSGITTQEGVTLEKLEWSGAPIRAVVTLRKGDERAELSADPGLISKNNELSRKSAQVEIESKFIEIPDAIAKDLIVEQFPGTPPDVSRNLASLAIVLSEKDAEALLMKLSSQEGVDVLSAPRVTTHSQQRAVVEIIREFRYPTEYERKEGKPVTPTAFETRNCGITLEVEAMLGEDGSTIDLKLAPQVVEFLGFISYPSGEMMPVKREPGQSFNDRLGAPKLPDKPYAPDETRQPIFSTRKTSTEVTIFSGHTVVFLGGAGGTDEIKGLPLPSAGKQLMVLVRARIVQSEERLASPEPNAAPPPAANSPSASDIPAAIPVEGKPGYVTSPHAPKAGYIDVRGFAAGTEIKDPYSGKIFRVP